MAKTKQLSMFPKAKSDCGGELLKKRAARMRGRPIATRETMHLVLRSTQAIGSMSFLRSRNSLLVRRILSKFASKHGVKVVSIANAGNHLHLHVKVASRHSYFSFIRAATGAIAMAVSGRTRWRKSDLALDGLVNDHAKKRTRFWDCRPYTRIVQSFAAYKFLQDYVRVNELEGLGFNRAHAREIVRGERSSRCLGANR